MVNIFDKVKKPLFVVAVVVVLFGTFLSGIFFGVSNRSSIEEVVGLKNKEIGKETDVDFSPFWKVWNILDEKFADSDTEANSQARVWGAIEGLVGSLGDPYSVFFPPIEAELFESSISGEFGGVGMEIGIRKNILTVIAPLKGTPAYRAGIKAGDMIIKIDETDTFDMTIDEAVRLIRGERGTAVTLTVLRESEDDSLEVSIVRDIIKIPVLETEIKDGVFVISLFNFSANSPDIFREALREFVLSDSQKLIIDLRGNPGGFLQASVDIASWFLPSGKVVAREEFGDGSEILYRSKGYDIFNNLPLVILVNKGSASASEILAGALSEHGIATLVGEKTFGKGSVQELVDVTPETSLKLTIARWLTPDGISISKKGLVPDYEVEITKEDYEEGRDPQFEKALELLK